MARDIFHSGNKKKSLQVSQYPNPFNSQTIIAFELPYDGFVTLKIYNVLGQEVVSLVNRDLQAGAHHSTWNAKNAASGIYFYRLEARGTVLQKKLILMK